MLYVGYGLLCCIPNMFNGIVVWSIGWHGNKVNALEQASFFQLLSYLSALVKWGIIPDDAKLLVRVVLQKMLECLEYFTGFLSGHLKQFTVEALLV